MIGLLEWQKTMCCVEAKPKRPLLRVCVTSRSHCRYRVQAVGAHPSARVWRLRARARLAEHLRGVHRVHHDSGATTCFPLFLLSSLESLEIFVVYARRSSIVMLIIKVVLALLMSINDCKGNTSINVQG